MSNFVHLHVHTHYSLLDGLGKIPDLLEKAKEFGMDACAITDHGVMYGAIEFYREAKKRGIKPIIGVEAYIAPRSLHDKTPKIDANSYHLVLLAKDLVGYKNLIKLVTLSHLEGFYYKPRIDKNVLAKHSQGLIALTSCLHGEIPQYILGGNMVLAKQMVREYLEIFSRENFYLEVQHHPSLADQETVNKGMFALAEEFGLGTVATNDVHYLYPADREAQEILLCVQTGKTLLDQDRLTMDADLSFRSPEEMIIAFKDHPEAIENTRKIADQCSLDLALGKTIFPHFTLPEGFTKLEYLRHLCLKGLVRRFGGSREEQEFDEEKILKGFDQEIIDRLEYELSVIQKCGFEDYFLIVSDFVNWAKQQKILVGPGRGSAAGSLVAYCLNITDINPLEYNLLFERFLNPERIAPPDIDMDFADSRRDEVINYVVSKYGADRVAQIVTFGTMGARNAVRDTGRVLGLSYSEVDQIAKAVPQHLPLKESIVANSELKDLYENDQTARRLLDLASRLEGVARHASTHAAGIVIAPDPLVEHVPLQKAISGESSMVITQYEMWSIEAIGLLKMDFLGLANLTILQNTLRIIRKVKNHEINLENIPLDDAKTFNLLARGETTGVFQLESEGMKRYLKELKPTVFEDIISMVALYRPGPMDSIPDFIAAKHGKKKIAYLDPRLEPILRSTYGVIVTQEQVLQIARDFAGFSFSEADILRKAVGKKIQSLLLEQRTKFIKGAVSHGSSPRVAEQVWDFIEPFARYGFNRAHATCYAMIAYQTAYLKTRYPSCFMAALLTSDQNNIDRIAIEVAECNRMGIKVLPPDINESFVEFAVVPETDNIRFALGAVKNVGSASAEAITETRKSGGKFWSLEDFVTRVPTRFLNKKVLESLIKSGALDSLGERNQMLASVEQILAYASDFQKRQLAGQLDIFGAIGESELLPIRLADVPPASKKQKLSWEKELLGIYISDHPLSELRSQLEKLPAISSLNEQMIGRSTKLGGIIIGIQKIVTRNGEPMVFAQLEDLTGWVELVVFPKIYQENAFLWQEGRIIFIEGKVSTKDGVLKILIDKAEELEPTLIKLASPKKEEEDKEKTKPLPVFFINLPEGANLDLLEKIKGILSRFTGEQEVVLIVPDGGELKKIKTSYKVDGSRELVLALKKVLE